MKKIIGFLMVIVTVMLMSCTQNQRVKHFGGTGNVDVEPGYKVVNVTWKDSDLWVLVKQMSPTDVPETYTFYEKSTWGLLNGKYIITEKSVGK